MTDKQRRSSYLLSLSLEKDITKSDIVFIKDALFEYISTTKRKMQRTTLSFYSDVIYFRCSIPLVFMEFHVFIRLVFLLGCSCSCHILTLSTHHSDHPSLFHPRLKTYTFSSDLSHHRLPSVLRTDSTAL